MTETPAGEDAVSGSASAPYSFQLQMLPQMLAQALASVLRQVPVQAITQQHLCAQCVLARMAWGASHDGDVRAAIGRAAQAAGISGDEAVTAQLDPAPFLPEEIRNSMPPLQEAVTTVNGTDVCADHVPGRPGGKTLLIAGGPLSPSALTALAGR